MSHFSEDDLILFHYGESVDPAAVEAHLAACGVCRERHEALARLLEAAGDLPLPARGNEYGPEVWRRIAPRLAPRPLAPVVRRSATPRWAALGAMAASLVVAFLLGRHWAPAPAPSPLPAPVRERILLLAVGDHLARSQTVLVELANADPGSPADFAPERRLAQELVGENRLYRQTALRAGEAGVADVLDDLERVLLEIAHSPKDPTAGELKALQQRIASRGVLFKVRVIGSHVRERQREIVGAAPATVS